MNKHFCSIRTFYLLIAIFLFADNAYAYIDPGTGSILLQAVIAGIVGCAVTLKMFWHKIKGFFQRSKGKKESSIDGEGK